MLRGDLATIIGHLGNPEIARWMSAAKQPFGQVEAEEILTLGQDPSHRIRVLEVGGAMVGCLCLVPDVWFWIDPAQQGRGLMSRALRAAIAAHFAGRAPPLIATCRDDNGPSRALLSALGFARMPDGRRMFFHSEGRARPCHDHVMTPEQWLYLHPPVQRHGCLTLRPALQKDAPTLALMLPRSGRDPSGVWPRPEALSGFIEAHRCRAPGRGLFVVEDAHRRAIGAVLRRAPAETSPVLYLPGENAARLAGDMAAILTAPPAGGAPPYSTMCE